MGLRARTACAATRSTMLDAIRRIATAECRASGSPREPEFALFDRFPLTDDDAATTDRVNRALRDFFADRAETIPQQTASEAFSDIPEALGVPYTYWCIGGVDPDTYSRAEVAGRVAQDIPVNDSATFAPVLQPNLDTGTRALVVAALAWLAPWLASVGSSVMARRPGPSAATARRSRCVDAEPQTEHPDQEAQAGGAQRHRRAEHLVGTAAVSDHDQRSADQSRDGVQPAAQHAGDLPDQHVAHRPTSHPGDRTEDDRLRWPDSQVEGLARSGDREQAQPGGVQHVDRGSQPTQPSAEQERNQPSAGSHRQVTPVAERGRWQGAEQDVAEDAPTHRCDHAEGDDTDDVHMRRSDRGQRAVQCERERPGKVQDEQQRRSGGHGSGLPHSTQDAAARPRRDRRSGAIRGMMALYAGRAHARLPDPSPAERTR
jgi:hypothetical protein